WINAISYPFHVTTTRTAHHHTDGIHNRIARNNGVSFVCNGDHSLKWTVRRGHPVKHQRSGTEKQSGNG
ncbi:hypothetical protein PFISCL1PPCAC_10753, partial [Pristionchus fissidentatus]